MTVALAGCGGSKPQPQPQAQPHPQPQPKLLVGAVEDAAKSAPDADAQMKLARASGFRAVVLSAVWKPGSSPAADVPPLARAVAAAVHEGVRPVLAVYQFSSATPDDPQSRAAFAAYAAGLAKRLPDVRDVIVGNEPNLNLFWQPQFDAAGADVAAPAFEALLAETYDALKAVDAKLDVIGAGLAPHGGDRPSSRPTHSPTKFIEDLGAAYRASGRTKPLMDALSIHVYGESARVPPTLAHPHSTTIGIADYPKLVATLGAAFAGTAQAGSSLPIVYGEYGVETAIPAAKSHLYTGHEPVPVVDEATQAKYYSEAIRMAERQENVRMLFLFHVSDESRLEGLQSGVRYADGSPKSSEPQVHAAIEAVPTR